MRVPSASCARQASAAERDMKVAGMLGPWSQHISASNNKSNQIHGFPTFNGHDLPTQHWGLEIHHDLWIGRVNIQLYQLVGHWVEHPWNWNGRDPRDPQCAASSGGAPIESPPLHSIVCLFALRMWAENVVGIPLRTSSDQRRWRESQRPRRFTRFFKKSRSNELLKRLGPSMC